uniref:Uncharacterized protein n=1 Tax=Leifsonia xyli subsp. cynodontis TaxID=31966 RepID=Q6XGD1_LEIXC|nr:unknown [Leifsonia xyli subsp. cynodontis]
MSATASSSGLATALPRSRPVPPVSFPVGARE